MASVHRREALTPNPLETKEELYRTNQILLKRSLNAVGDRIVKKGIPLDVTVIHPIESVNFSFFLYIVNLQSKQTLIGNVG